MMLKKPTCDVEFSFGDGTLGNTNGSLVSMTLATTGEVVVIFSSSSLSLSSSAKSSSLLRSKMGRPKNASWNVVSLPGYGRHVRLNNHF